MLIDQGAPPEVIEQARGASSEAHELELFEDNVPAVEVFQCMGTQWRTRGMDGALQGLDYNVLPAVMRLCGVPAKARKIVFEDVRIMEIETLKIVSERKE